MHANATVGRGVLLPVPLVAVPVLWRQGVWRRPTFGGGESLSPRWKGAAVPRTASSAVPGLVVAPLRSVGGRVGGDQCSHHEYMFGLWWLRPPPNRLRPPQRLRPVPDPLLRQRAVLRLRPPIARLRLRPPKAGRSASAERPASVKPSASTSANTSCPRVLPLRGTGTRLTPLSSFHIQNGCDRFGEFRRCAKLRDGSLEVEFSSSHDAARALKATELVYSMKCGSQRRDVK